jgi:hypothetical protein
MRSHAAQDALFRELSGTGQTGQEFGASIQGMEVTPQSRVVDAERVGGDVVVEFDSGECALYSAALLHSVLTRATELSDTLAEEVQIESPFDRSFKSGRITS